MKQMVYTNNPAIYGETLIQGTYKGFEYYVISYGTHPCAYVSIPKGHKLYRKHYGDCAEISNIKCHGGITYSEGCLGINLDTVINGWFIGWDYSHLGDYHAGFWGMKDGKQWTTQELIDECKAVINQIKED